MSSSPSSEKKQPSLGRVYPYNLYVSVPWSFSNTDPTPSFYDPDLFTEPTYTWVNADNLGEVNFSKFYYTKLNVPVNSSFVTYSFYPTGARRYLISVDKVSGEDKPLLRVLGKNENNEEALIEPVEKNGRWYYTLDAAVLGFTDKLVTLVRYVYESGYYSMYGRRATNFIISDEYGGYTKNFNVNLIVAGKFMGTSDNVTVEELAERLYARLNYALNPGGVGVRKVNILYANDHPTVGKDFPPSDAVVLYRDRAKRPASLDSLSNWPGHEGEINFILGYYEGEASSVGGYSPQPGEIYNDHKPINCESSSITNRQVPCLTNVSILTHLDGGKQALASRNITSSAIHELGHFFGLEHTSSWGSSPEFDKLSDTPECTNIEAKASVLKECPDYGYIMFPYSNYEFEYTTFTPRQMEIIRAYLASVPHK